MNKRQIIASLNDIANELDINGLYKEASSLTNVMKRLAEEEISDTPERLSPSNYNSGETNQNDPDFVKKSFLRYANSNVWKFAHLVEGLLKESGFLHSQEMWKTIFTMISLYYPPDSLGIGNSKALVVLENIWNEYKNLKNETIQQAPLSSDISAQSGLPMANEEQNNIVQEQSNLFTALTLDRLKQKMKSSARMNLEYMDDTNFPNLINLVEENIEPGYTTKYSPEKPGQ